MAAFTSTSLKKKAQLRTAVWYLTLREVTTKQHHPWGKELEERKSES